MQQDRELTYRSRLSQRLKTQRSIKTKRNTNSMQQHKGTFNWLYMRKGTLKGPITNRRKTEINATAKTVYVFMVELKKKQEKQKNGTQVTFHHAFLFTLKGPITNRRKTKTNTIAKTVITVNSLTGRSFQDRKNHRKQKLTTSGDLKKLFQGKTT